MVRLTLALIAVSSTACGADVGGADVGGDAGVDTGFDTGICPRPAPTPACGFVGTQDLVGFGQLNHAVFGDGVLYGASTGLEVVALREDGVSSAAPIPSVDTEGFAALAVQGELAFVVERYRLSPILDFNHRLRIADVSDPCLPRWLGQLDLAEGRTGPIALADERAFVWLREGDAPTLAVVDISDPSAPSLLTTVESTLPSYVNDMEVIGDRLYASGWDSVPPVLEEGVSFRLVAFDIGADTPTEVLSVLLGPVGGRQTPNAELAPAGDGRVLVSGSTVAGPAGVGGPQGVLFVVDVAAPGSVVSTVPVEETAFFTLDADGQTAVAQTTQGPVAIDL